MSITCISVHNIDRMTLEEQKELKGVGTQTWAQRIRFHADDGTELEVTVFSKKPIYFTRYEGELKEALRRVK